MKKRTGAEWQTLLAAYRAGDLSEKDWCEANGVNIHTFKNRIRKERKMEGEKTPIAERPRGKEKREKGTVYRSVKWVPVAGHSERQNATKMSVFVGDVEILIAEDYNEELLLRVCGSLKKLC